MIMVILDREIQPVKGCIRIAKRKEGCPLHKGCKHFTFLLKKLTRRGKVGIINECSFCVLCLNLHRDCNCHYLRREASHIVPLRRRCAYITELREWYCVILFRYVLPMHLTVIRNCWLATMTREAL